MSEAGRPLSPHLSIYRPQLTSVLSILHRFTGVALGGGLLLFVWWLVAAAAGPEAFAAAQGFFGSIPGGVMLFAASWRSSTICATASGTSCGTPATVTKSPMSTVRAGRSCGVAGAHAGGVGLRLRRGVRLVSGMRTPLSRGARFRGRRRGNGALVGAAGHRHRARAAGVVAGGVVDGARRREP